MPVVTLRPNGQVSTQWTRMGGAPSNWQAVSNVSPVWWNETEAGSRTDDFTFSDLPANASVVNLVTLHWLAHSDGGAQAEAFFIHSGTTFGQGTETMPAEPTLFSYPLDKLGGIPWLVSDINAMRAGYRTAPGLPIGLLVSDEMWLEVDITVTPAVTTPEEAVDLPLERTEAALPLDRGSAQTLPLDRLERSLPLERDPASLGLERTETVLTLTRGEAVSLPLERREAALTLDRGATESLPLERTERALPLERATVDLRVIRDVEASLELRED